MSANNVNFNGSFDMEYVPSGRLSNMFPYHQLPLNTKITLGDTVLGIRGLPTHHVGYSFMPQDYMRKVVSIKNGEQETFDINEKYHLPLTFSPQNGACLIHLEEEPVEFDVTFDRNKVRDQVVSLDKVVLSLAGVMDSFLKDLEANKVYSLLDDLEVELNPLWESGEVAEIFSKKGLAGYSFDRSSSTSRIMDQLDYKKGKTANYSSFIDTLTQRQRFEWNNIVSGLRAIYPSSSAEELYPLVKIKPQEPIS